MNDLYEDFIKNIPPDKPLYDYCTCSSCKKSYTGNKKNFKYCYNSKIYRCELWNNMIVDKEFKCEFYDPIIISGLQQMMLKLVVKSYPKSIAKELVEVNSSDIFCFERE